MKKQSLLAAAIVVSLAVGAPSAAHAIPPQFFGVVSAKFDPTAAEFNRMGSGKVGRHRVSFAWASVQTNGPDNFDWSRYDAVVGAAAENGIQTLATVYGTPSWAAARPNHPPKKQYVDEFETFLRELVRRYGPNGTFWLLNPLIPRVPITDWQLFNEVNSPTFWLKKPSPKQYKPLLVAANRAIKGEDPNARIILAGLFQNPRIKNGLTSERYLTGLYRLKAKKLFDAVAVHPYSTTPGRVLKAVTQTRLLMNRFKDSSTPIWLTEVGWATGGRKTPLTVSFGKQANNLVRTYKLAASKRKSLGIEAVFWYSLKDVPGSSNLWVDHAGLLTSGGKPKPSWNAFVGLTGGTP
jgi:polysaccharide biosynthesis protein PslG